MQFFSQTPYFIKQFAVILAIGELMQEWLFKDQSRLHLSELMTEA